MKEQEYAKCNAKSMKESILRQAQYDNNGVELN